MRAVFVLIAACLLASALAADVVDLGERDSRSGSFKKFTKVVGKDKPAIVFFYLPGCGHCRGFQPEFREAANHFSEDDVVFARVNADRWDVLSKEYNVERVPDIRFCPAGARGNECQRYPEYSPNTASGVIEFLNGRVGSRFLQSNTDTEVDAATAAAIAATKGTCPVVYHDKTEMAFSQVHAQTEEEAVEAELDEEESDLEAGEEEEFESESDEEAEDEMEADEEADEEVDEADEAVSEEEADEAVDEEAEEETNEATVDEADEEADEEVEEETDEEEALEGDVSDEEHADAHAESEEEMTAFFEVAHAKIDEAMAAFRDENGN